MSKRMIDKIMHLLFFGITLISASVIVFIVLFIIVKGLAPFISYGENNVDIFKFLFSTTWYQAPNIYGIGFVIINTIYIVFLSILLAAPVSILTALFICKIASKKISVILEYVIELLASIPSIIYGAFGMMVVTILVKNLANIFNYQSAGGISSLATIIVLAMMIMPTITLVSITSIKAVKSDVIKGSLALGASVMQTNFKVVLVTAKSGIFSGIILGVGRALGEATAVSMVAGNAGSGPNFNLFATTRTLTSTMLLGLKESSGLDYDIRFSVGIVLILIIILSNMSLNYVKKKIGS